MKPRLEAEGRWAGRIELERNDMMKAACKQGMSKSDAQAWVYAELDRMYPPTEHSLCPGTMSEHEIVPSSPRTGPDSGQIQGLSDLPEG